MQTLAFGQAIGQGWPQVGDLALALALSALIGLEREIRGKSAGLRTHTIIGFASALIMLVSKYGFGDVLGDHVVLDPSRVAAQIVSGVGFIGGGLIFVRRDAVRGLTTAASVWLTTAIGMAAGAGLPILAIVTTVGFFLIVYGLRPIARRLPSFEPGTVTLKITYLDGRGILHELIQECTHAGWNVADLSTERTTIEATSAIPVVNVEIELLGNGNYHELISTITNNSGVLSVNALPFEDDF
ncbi:MAG: MgtC/SapB family protein [Acidimicrobiia bacterium]